MYHIALFLHILGVLCLMGWHTLIHASLEVMRRAQTVERVQAEVMLESFTTDPNAVLTPAPCVAPA